MGSYSIKDLERLTGIKAHTIRIWEKRYRLIEPQRTSTNIRYYSDDDLKRVINVAALNSQGLRISKIAGMTRKEVNQRVLEIGNLKTDYDLYIDQLIVAMVDLDEQAFEKVLQQVEGKVSFEICVTDVVYPFLEKIGLLWQTGSIHPAQEHFISNLIRQRLIVAIAGLPPASRKQKTAILFLPEGELHEIGLLFFQYVLRSKGWKTYYLGQSVPRRDLLSVYKTHGADVLITSLISAPQPGLVERFIQQLANDFSGATILVSGLRVRNTAFHIPKNVMLFYRATELPALLRSL